MKKQNGFGLIGILIVIGVLALTAGGVVMWRGISPPTGPIQPISQPTQEPEARGSTVTVKTDKTKYQNNGLVFEPVGFTIANNSGRTIYYLEGCAVRFPGACLVKGNECQPLPGPKIICGAEPSVAELGSGRTFHSYWDQIQGQDEFVPSGQYRLVFSYSFEGVPFSSSHTLGETKTVYSQPITINQVSLTRETTLSICQIWESVVSVDDLAYPADWCKMKLKQKFGD